MEDDVCSALKGCIGRPICFIFVCVGGSAAGVFFVGLLAHVTGASDAAEPGRFSVSLDCDFRVHTNASLTSRSKIVYELPQGTILSEGFKSISHGWGARRVSGLTVTNGSGAALPFEFRKGGGWLTVIFAFNPPIRGPITYPVYLEYMVTDAICGGGSENELYYADWTGQWEVPVSQSNFSLGFDPEVGADLAGVCAGSATGTSCASPRSSALGKNLSLARPERFFVSGGSVLYLMSGAPKDLHFSWPPRILASNKDCSDSKAYSLQKAFAPHTLKIVLGLILILAAFSIGVQWYYAKQSAGHDGSGAYSAVLEKDTSLSGRGNLNRGVSHGV